MRISDWSSDVCSSDLGYPRFRHPPCPRDAARRFAVLGLLPDDGAARQPRAQDRLVPREGPRLPRQFRAVFDPELGGGDVRPGHLARGVRPARRRARRRPGRPRSEEHTSELQSLMRTSSAVFCWQQKKNTTTGLATLVTMVTENE